MEERFLIFFLKRSGYYFAYTHVQKMVYNNCIGSVHALRGEKKGPSTHCLRMRQNIL